MRRLIPFALVTVLLLGALTAWAVNLTLSFTQAQVDVATWKYSTASAAQKAAFPTLQLWFANEVSTMIAGWAAEKQASEAASVCTRFNALSGANKTTACNFFSLTSGQTFAQDSAGFVAVCP